MAHILLIEDEPQVCDTVSRMLRNAGHTVSAAGDGNEGLAAIDRGNFDLIVADLLLPEKDGLEIISRLRNQGDNTPILAISGGGQTRHMDLLGYAKTFGANAVLAKPFRPADILAAVDDILLGATL